MAPPFSKSSLVLEDCEGAPDWFVEGPLPILGAFMSECDSALATLERGPNLMGRITTNVRLAYTGSPSPDADPFPLYLSTEGMARPPQAVWIGKVSRRSGTVQPVALQPIWELASDGKRVKVRYITGLAITDEVYTLTFLME